MLLNAKRKCRMINCVAYKHLERTDQPINLVMQDDQLRRLQTPRTHGSTN